MPYDSRPCSEASKLDRALAVAAALVARYEGTPFEAEAIHTFERVERERAKQFIRNDVKARAMSILREEQEARSQSYSPIIPKYKEFSMAVDRRCAIISGLAD